MYLNKAFLIGNLTRDPEMKSLPSGIKVTTFGLATNRVWKNKEGVKQENTDFHNIVVFGRQAETSAQYLKKGASALVEGRMQTRSWDAADGVKKYRTEVIADNIQFGPRTVGTGAGAFSDQTSANAGGVKSENLNKSENIDTIEYPEGEINPEDIPF
ncbi:MAG: single-stranded DNA-binding protein [Patescibacteria group bacterium]|nr:single-stranded DNA-binding protein [Patescibacteria group bacterium]MDE1988651.1 single-stranded DNA-binding protein [Patescibacteria group bacterium]MDE2218115.1 single-stranded DNA-binding protein [Patescibacteria group bacterium]